MATWQCFILDRRDYRDRLIGERTIRTVELARHWEDCTPTEAAVFVLFTNIPVRLADSNEAEAAA